MSIAELQKHQNCWVHRLAPNYTYYCIIKIEYSIKIVITLIFVEHKERLLAWNQLHFKYEAYDTNQLAYLIIWSDICWPVIDKFLSVGLNDGAEESKTWLPNSWILIKITKFCTMKKHY